jgi:hypothetical protein
MFKNIASFCIFFVLLLTNLNVSEARVKKQKNSSRKSRISKIKHKRKNKRYRYGNGPDLKSITKDSPFTENSNNGINPIEN